MARIRTLLAAGAASTCVVALAAVALPAGSATGATTGVSTGLSTGLSSASQDPFWFFRQPCGGERPPKPGGGRYRCSFEDDFTGWGLDTDTWLVAETETTGVSTGNGDCHVDHPNNVSQSGGTLRLTARTEPRPFVCESLRGAFTTDTTAASIGTNDSFAQAYGRFEYRARYPSTDEAGFHANFWLMPNEWKYGAWPRSGEVDIAEWFSNVHRFVFPSLHYTGEDGTSTGWWTCPMETATTRFHRYAVEWTPSSMSFFYDGEKCFEHVWTPSWPLRRPQPFDQPFHVLLSVRHGTGGNAATSETPAWGTLAVDWVRVWE